jgi:hypothetical protein
MLSKSNGYRITYLPVLGVAIGADDSDQDLRLFRNSGELLSALDVEARN